MRSSGIQPGLALFELLPAVASIPVGITIGQIVYISSNSMLLGVFVGVISIPIAFLVIFYALVLAFIVPYIIYDKLLGRPSPRDEYFDDPVN